MATSKFQEELAARRAKQEKDRSSVGDEIMAIYGDGSAADAGWHKNGSVTNGKVNGSAKISTATAEVPDFSKLDIPSIPEYEQSPADQKLDALIRALPVTQAYKRWIPKGTPERRWDGQNESIMIRCPFPHHNDEHPSAWCNTEKNVWYCIKCNYGGDVYDLAAIRFGYAVPGYKKASGQFGALRADMAKDFGIEIVKGLNGTEYAVGPADGTTAPSTQQAAPVPPPRQANGDAPRQAFQIPGLTKMKITLPGQAGPPAQQAPTPPVQAAPVAPVTPPTVQAPPTVPPPQPAPVPTPTPEPVPPQAPAPVTAPVQPVHTGFQIPGFKSMNLGTQMPPSAPPVQNLAPAPSPALALQITVPGDLILAKYGLTSEGDDTGDGGFSGIALDWQGITPPETFLGQYMAVATADEAPEEFHYFSGLAALGLATGRDVMMLDKNPVKGNLFICLLGETGGGKSNAKRYMTQLVSRALPYDADDPGNKGVKRISNPASAEYMVREFMKTLKDPLTNQPIGGAPVRGIVDFEEFATLMNRASQSGSSLSQFMIQFFDGDDEVRTGSLTRGDYVASKPFATTFSTTQPLALRELVSDRHLQDGFLNRWVFVTGPEKPPIPLGGEVISIESLIHPLQQVFGWVGLQDKIITWEPDAFREAYNFLMEVIIPAKRADRTGATSRIDLIYKKMILLNTINLKRSKVPVEAVRFANKTYRYLVNTYGLLDKAVNQAVDEDLRQTVMRAILAIHKKNNKPPSLPEISNKVGSRKYTQKQILETIQVMHKLGHIEELPPPPGPGRPTVRYRIIASD